MSTEELERLKEECASLVHEWYNDPPPKAAQVISATFIIVRQRVLIQALESRVKFLEGQLDSIEEEEAEK